MEQQPPPYSQDIPTARPYNPSQQPGYPPQPGQSQPAAYPPPQQYQGYPPPQQHQPQHQPQYQPQHQQQAPVTQQPQSGLHGRDQATAERRQREQHQTDLALGLACGGFLCCLCVGTERAAKMGRGVVDFLLCMHCRCFGF